MRQTRSPSLLSSRPRVTINHRAVHRRYEDATFELDKTAFFLSHTFLMSLAAAPSAMAATEAISSPFQGVQSNSLYVTLALFLMSVPGIWSQVKRAPVANKKRKTFEVCTRPLPPSPTLSFPTI